jgi:hypothetical protein
MVFADFEMEEQKLHSIGQIKNPTDYYDPYKPLEGVYYSIPLKIFMTGDDIGVSILTWPPFVDLDVLDRVRKGRH